MTLVPPTILTPRLELVPLLPDVADALLAGRPADAGLAVPDGWPDDHDAGFIALRRRQSDADPTVPVWVRLALLRAGVDAGEGAGAAGAPAATGAAPAPVRQCIGHAGFHGPPGVNGGGVTGALEVGYTIFPAWRGRGLAQEAVRGLVAWAAAEHGVRHFFGSVAPDNAPSHAVLGRTGFVQVGEQWDDEDGRELVYELRLH